MKPNRTRSATPTFTTALKLVPPETQSFGSMLRFLRLRARLNQRDLAIAVGYSESQICRLEQNGRAPDVDAVRALLIPALQIEADSAEATRLLELAQLARVSRNETADRSQAAPTGEGAAMQLGRLPTPLTPLIDRVDELHELRRLLERSHTRLVTLVGPPGIGKTRLALHVAASVQSSFADGVAFVELAAVQQADGVLPAIAQSLGLKLSDSRRAQQALAALLGNKQLLLVLDNLEQVVGVGPALVELLQLAPRLSMLATSRIALGVSGEQQYPVPPLELPAPHQAQSPEDLLNIPAVQLFVTRVQAVQPQFMLTSANAAAVASICMRLDGLPLALELAAARSKLFPPQALLKQLNNPGGPLQLLVDGPRDLPDHQQTLRGTLAWSYNLLRPAEQWVLRQLGVFVGGCSFEAAESVCGRAGAPEAGAYGVLSILATLANQNLVLCSHDDEGNGRVAMLETMREFALEQLQREGELDAARASHAAHYGELVVQAEPALQGPQQAEWLQRLHADVGNLQAMLLWHSQHEPELALRYASQLRIFWVTRSYLHEGRTWLEGLLAARPAPATTLDAQALAALALIADYQDDFQQAQRWLEESLVLARQLDDQRTVRVVLANRSSVLFRLGKREAALACCQENLVLCEANGDWLNKGQTLNLLGLMEKDHGRYEPALAWLQQSLACFQRVGHVRGLAWVHLTIANARYWLGHYPQAHRHGSESLRLYTLLGDEANIAWALESTAMSAFRTGACAAGEELLGQALAWFRKYNRRDGVALALLELGQIAEQQGHAGRALALQREALAIALANGEKRRLAFCLEGTASALAGSQPHVAVQLLGAAERLREEADVPLPPCEQATYTALLARLRGHMADDAFNDAWQAGRAQPLHGVVQAALQE
ncbi:MAG: tetratricopeptide repeat protein [Chloroflexaceae bacterium]|jgi:predicted ATPase|nr:tetratricopeptide repeat protein [Chloroflexaceae bacterium]